MNVPTPRPALRRAPDAHVSPAAPEVVGEALPASAGVKQRKSSSGSGDRKDKKGKKRRSELRVRLPKGLRAQFDERVEEEGYEADDVVAMLIQAWLNR